MMSHESLYGYGQISLPDSKELGLFPQMDARAGNGNLYYSTDECIGKETELIIFASVYLTYETEGTKSDHLTLSGIVERVEGEAKGTWTAEHIQTVSGGDHSIVEEFHGIIREGEHTPVRLVPGNRLAERGVTPD